MKELILVLVAFWNTPATLVTASAPQAMSLFSVFLKTDRKEAESGPISLLR